MPTPSATYSLEPKLPPPDPDPENPQPNPNPDEPGGIPIQDPLGPPPEPFTM